MKPNRLSPVVILVLALCLFLPSASATLTCEGEGQAFFIPEFVEKETISIPCTLETLNPINASCVAMVYHEGELISVTPEIQDIGLFGRSSYIEVDSDNTIESFVVTLSNKDLLHLTEFGWEVWCKESVGTFHSSEGNLTTEYPFAEPVVRKSIVFMQRDVGQLVGLFFITIIVLIIFGLAVKVVLNR